MATKKPTLDTHSRPCCGECYYCHQISECTTRIGCYVNPPQYSYGEEESPVFMDYAPVQSTRPACKDFKPRSTN